MSKSKKPLKRNSKPKGDLGLLSNPLVWILGGLILLAGTFFVVWRSGQPPITQSPPVDSEVSGAPSLKVDQEKVDLGDVPLDKTVTVTFQLSNTGDETLRFTQQPFIEVKEGC